MVGSSDLPGTGVTVPRITTITRKWRLKVLETRIQVVRGFLSIKRIFYGATGVLSQQEENSRFKVILGEWFWRRFSIEDQITHLLRGTMKGPDDHLLLLTGSSSRECVGSLI